MSSGDVTCCIAHSSRLAAKCRARAARNSDILCERMSDSGDNTNSYNDGNSPGVHSGDITASSGATQNQPLVLDQASLDAIISGVSAKIMSQPGSQPASTVAGRNAPPSSTSIANEQRSGRPGDTLAGEFAEYNPLCLARYDKTLVLLPLRPVHGRVIRTGPHYSTHSDCTRMHGSVAVVAA